MELHHLVPTPPPADAGQLCKICNMWLNGPKQWQDHINCNKHRQGVTEQKDIAKQQSS